MSDIDIKAIAASVADELTEHPERWTQDYYAREADGRQGTIDGPDSVCWCLVGHIARREPGMIPQSKVAPVFQQTLVAMGSDLSVPRWNDDPSRTVADVIALCRKIAQETK